MSRKQHIDHVLLGHRLFGYMPKLGIDGVEHVIRAGKGKYSLDVVQGFREAEELAELRPLLPLTNYYLLSAL